MTHEISASMEFVSRFTVDTQQIKGKLFPQDTASLSLWVCCGQLQRLRSRDLNRTRRNFGNSSYHHLWDPRISPFEVSTITGMVAEFQRFRAPSDRSPFQGVGAALVPERTDVRAIGSLAAVWASMTCV